MQDLTIQLPSRRPLRILCLGAHCDDIDIGCGGTLLRMLRERGKTEVTWVVFSASAERRQELRGSARRFLRGAARWDVRTYDFRDGYFPAHYAAIKETFESIRTGLDPDIIFTHHGADLHQDHRVVSELTWCAFRRHFILEYEVPKYDGGLLPPNAFVRLDSSLVESKIRILMSCYQSQLVKSWFTADTFRSLGRLRGIESGGRPVGLKDSMHGSFASHDRQAARGQPSQ